jgi:tRNA pseudouridine38-40 synthase
MRIACGIEYDGSGYCGWQTQLGVPTVQQTVEAALSKVADHPVRVVCAGRTDTGVHAVSQVFHFDTEAARPPHSWVLGANVNMPKDLSLQWAQQVDEGFHARFSAVARRYCYLILNRRIRSSLWHRRATWNHKPLDVSRMAEAARHLLGEHDFSSFRAVACQAKSAVRTVHELDIARRGELIQLDIKANGFLQHMVRNIAGVLMSIGAGECETVWAREVLEHRDRCLGGVTAPPDGLYFVGIYYPQRFGIRQPQEPFSQASLITPPPT